MFARLCVIAILLVVVLILVVYDDMQLLISSRNLEFFTNGYHYLIQILLVAVVAPMYFSGKIEFGNPKFETYIMRNRVKGSLPFLTGVPNLKNDGGKYDKPTTDDLIKILEDVRLGYILSRFGTLDSIYEWSSVLSLGEQQRLAFARLLLSKPKLALLDEATSALDEPNETHLYERIAAACITYISVGHRRTLREYHNSILQISTADPPDCNQQNWLIEPISRNNSYNMSQQ